MKRKLKFALTAFVASCSILLLSCSAIRDNAVKDIEHEAVAEALQNDELNVTLLNFVPISKEDSYFDISGGSFVIRIRGDKAIANLPKLDSTINGAGTLSRLGTSINEYNCKRAASDKRHVTYVLTDIYGSLGQKIKVVCYYSGSARVKVDSNYATWPSYEYNALIDIPQDPD